MMPERPSRSEASTSGASPPMADTMPMPVTATRRISEFLSDGLSRHRTKQSNPDSGGREDRLAVGLQLAVGDGQHDPATAHAADVDDCSEAVLRAGVTMPPELDGLDAKRTALALFSKPAEEETGLSARGRPVLGTPALLDHQ